MPCVMLPFIAAIYLFAVTSPQLVNAQWSPWVVSPCSVTCGNGTQQRNRSCDDSSQSNSSMQCIGNYDDSQPCFLKSCARGTNGSWSSWVAGACSTTCGQGMQKRTRTCSNPAPSGGGQACIGQPMQAVTCSIKPCSGTQKKLDGAWSEWVNGECCVTCGDGSLLSRRTCTNPAPAGGGKTCQGPDKQALLCKLKDCPVNGAWTDWKNGECTVTCGKGTQMRSRTCTNPAPSGTGAQCIGVRKQAVQCSLSVCVVNGVWTSWTNGACSVTCGNGVRTKTRSCTNPKPAGGGLPCEGKAKNTVLCNLVECAVNGGWSNWVNGKCTVTCGDGTQMRTRTCTNPAPSGGGTDCSGIKRESTYCTESPCGG